MASSSAMESNSGDGPRQPSRQEYCRLWDEYASTVGQLIMLFPWAQARPQDGRLLIRCTKCGRAGRRYNAIPVRVESLLAHGRGRGHVRAVENDPETTILELVELSRLQANMTRATSRADRFRHDPEQYGPEYEAP